MPRRSTVSHLALALTITATPAALQAQGTVLDRGSFRLTVAGQEVGTETFTIRQDGTGPTGITIAQGTVTLDTGNVAQEFTSWLRLTPGAGRTAEYRLNVQGSAHEQITGAMAGGRFSARIVSPAGEQMREYLASDGAIVVDEGIAHQYYFLARRAGSTTARVPVLVPRQSRQILVTVTSSGTQPLDIAGRRVDARRLVVSANGLTTHEVWVDGDGRVLRVAIPSSGFVATRTSLPT